MSQVTKTTSELAPPLPHMLRKGIELGSSSGKDLGYKLDIEMKSSMVRKIFPAHKYAGVWNDREAEIQPLLL
ncbi:hypothetical protein TNCV_3459491 [Trichonephila clavipes]|nr:hypothetical protein TNCV_3459491 [Trichonephila clavipes]